MLWSILDKRLASRPIYSRAALMECLQEEWGNIDQDLCIKLVESMPETNTKVCKGKRWTFHVNKIVFVLIILKIN